MTTLASVDLKSDRGSIHLPVNSAWREKASQTFSKVKEVANVVFISLLTIALFATNPGMCFISLVIGIAFSKSIDKAVNRIKVFLSAYSVPVIIGCWGIGMLVLPVFLATAAVIWQASLGSYLSKKANEKMLYKA
ncbi:hypothetical protein DB42_CE00070 [Neochlamydia sp. EPS4]|uniref:hypothetical protein n=1 Tax=Neochlamydia sp. EPS4 TaxID=1478175 RepID=UPI000582A1A8|nr:hypothetical protein [Neochlamydia sp. EPS4]KIC73202.1 hypothetical protein DB42_CE00070 [Neochlamydia sp. EPS4]